MAENRKSDPAARAEELEQQLIKAEPLRSLGALAGGVAHRFNNLLSVILGYASYVANREDLSEESAKAMDEIAAAAQKGRQLTNELLAFSNKEQEDPESCSVHETLNSVISILSSQFHSSIELKKEFNAGLDAVEAPPSAIWQLVFSLLSSAAESAVGGGRLTVRTHNTSADETTDGDELVLIEVREESGGGNGISAEDLRDAGRIATMSGIVGTLQGAVSVSNEDNGASVITVALPLSRDEEEKAAPAAGASKLGACRIWVIDDDPIFCEMCSRVLSDEGHTITVIDNGTDFRAQWQAAEEKPDLLIIDFSMTDYNGLELCEWLDEQGSRTPVILVSGFSAGQPGIKKASAFKWTHFLQKPFSFQELTDLVALALGDKLIA